MVSPVDVVKGTPDDSASFHLSPAVSLLPRSLAGHQLKSEGKEAITVKGNSSRRERKAEHYTYAIRTPPICGSGRQAEPAVERNAYCIGDDKNAMFYANHRGRQPKERTEQEPQKCGAATAAEIVAHTWPMGSCRPGAGRSSRLHPAGMRPGCTTHSIVIVRAGPRQLPCLPPQPREEKRRAQAPQTRPCCALRERRGLRRSLNV